MQQRPNDWLNAAGHTNIFCQQKFSVLARGIPVNASDISNQKMRLPSYRNQTLTTRGARIFQTRWRHLYYPLWSLSPESCSGSMANNLVHVTNQVDRNFLTSFWDNHLVEVPAQLLQVDNRPNDHVLSPLLVKYCKIDTRFTIIRQAVAERSLHLQIFKFPASWHSSQKLTHIPDLVSLPVLYQSQAPRAQVMRHVKWWNHGVSNALRRETSNPSPAPPSIHRPLV